MSRNRWMVLAAILPIVGFFCHHKLPAQTTRSSRTRDGKDLQQIIVPMKSAEAEDVVERMNEYLSTVGVHLGHVTEYEMFCRQVRIVEILGANSVLIMSPPEVAEHVKKMVEALDVPLPPLPRIIIHAAIAEDAPREQSRLYYLGYPKLSVTTGETVSFNFGEGSIIWRFPGKKFCLRATIVDKNKVAMNVVTELPTGKEQLEKDPVTVVRTAEFTAYSYRVDPSSYMVQRTEQAVTAAAGETVRLETNYFERHPEGYYSPTKVILFLTPRIAYTRLQARRFWKEKHSWETGLPRFSL